MHKPEFPLESLPHSKWILNLHWDALDLEQSVARRSMEQQGRTLLIPAKVHAYIPTAFPGTGNAQCGH